MAAPLHSTPRPGGRPPGLGGLVGAWFDRLMPVVLLAGLGVLLGLQYMAPDKRVLSVLVGLVVAGIAWRLDIISGIGVMILALPFPKGTTFGTTNLALILLVAIIYLLRFAQRELPRPRGTPLDMAIVGLFIAYVVSFFNVTDPVNLGPALANFELFVGTLVMFFIVVNSIQSVEDLKRLHQFQIITLALIAGLALYELTHPGTAIVPGWIDFTHTEGEVFNSRNVRVGGTFYDYELLADFCGLNVVFMAFHFARAGSVARRAFTGLLLGVIVFIMFATVTRGPIISLGVAVAYLMWRTRRHLNAVNVTMTAGAAAAIMLAANFIVANFTRSGDLFARLGQTEIKGFVPDTRAAAWSSAWERFLMHPLIGSGPYYSLAHGLKTWFFPHNLYLYVANIIGLFGLMFFLWLLARLFMVVKSAVDSPTHPDYLEAYLLMARVQLVFFLADQFKIEYLRNATYQYQVWLMLALWVAAERLRADARLGRLRASA